MKATNKQKAWEIADSIIDGDYMKDDNRSLKAGYDILVSTANNGEWISDLGTRLEINKADGTSVNVWIEDKETEVENFGIAMNQTSEKSFYIVLSNGERIDIIKDAEHKDDNGTTVWKWKIATQFFSKDEWAKEYLKRLITERLTGIRIIFHIEQKTPDICGTNGIGCRSLNRCNTMLCSGCPVAEQFFAKQDGVTLKYL
jgi:hypothetical protein